jgi:hypothetical protein
MKAKLLLIAFLLFFQFSYSQEEKKITPIHLVKIDVLKSAFCQLHFNYEFYNGKRLGEEIGFSYIYPNRVISFINEERYEGGYFDRTAGHYHGYGLEFRQKFYYPLYSGSPYLAFVLTSKYKHFKNASIRIDDHNGSNPSYEIVSSTRYIYAISVMVGFVTSFKYNFLIDVNAGIGLGYFDTLTKREDSPNYYYFNSIRPGHSRFYSPVIKCGVKLCFGFKGKQNSE